MGRGLSAPGGGAAPAEPDAVALVAEVSFVEAGLPEGAFLPLVPADLGGLSSWPVSSTNCGCVRERRIKDTLALSQVRIGTKFQFLHLVQWDIILYAVPASSNHPRSGYTACCRTVSWIYSVEQLSLALNLFLLDCRLEFCSFLLALLAFTFTLLPLLRWHPPSAGWSTRELAGSHSYDKKSLEN